MRWREVGVRAETPTRCGSGIAITSSRWRRRRIRNCAVRSRPRGCGAWTRSTRTCALLSNRASRLQGRAAALRLCGALQHFWSMRGYLSEGRDGARGFCRGRERGATRERASALSAAGALAYLQADYRGRQALHEESLAIRRQLGDRRGIAPRSVTSALWPAITGDFASAQALFEESLAILRELGDPWGIAIALGNLGQCRLRAGRLPAARSRHEESLAIKRKLGNRAGVASRCSVWRTWCTPRATLRPPRRCNSRVFRSRGSSETGSIANA